ncbi:helix-turn-helix transcriptional regulator [Streptomyces sp. NPDC051907]
MANEVYKALNRIKELRIEKGVTQSTVAKAIGISQGMLTNYETGKRSPRDFKVWQDLADYFDVTTSYIMGTSDFRTYQDEINEIQTSAKENYGVEVPAEIIKDYKGNPVSTTYNTLALRTEMAKKLLPELDKMISTIDSYLYSSPTIDFDDKEKADYFYSDEFKLANAQIDQLLI